MLIDDSIRSENAMPAPVVGSKKGLLAHMIGNACVPAVDEPASD